LGSLTRNVVVLDIATAWMQAQSLIMNGDLYADRRAVYLMGFLIQSFFWYGYDVGMHYDYLWRVQALPLVLPAL
jgi:hypothetical protein